MIVFRLQNVDHELSPTDFGRIFDITPRHLDKAPKRFSFPTFWRYLAREPYSKLSNVHGHSIEHPVIRIFLRLLAHTFFGRHEVQKPTAIELGLIGGVLNCERDYPFQINLVSNFCNHVLKAQKGDLKSIDFGGIVSHIARHFNPNFSRGLTPVTPEIPLIDIAYLRLLKWIHRDHQRWVLDSGVSFPLPYPDLPRLQFLPEAQRGVQYQPPSYLIDLPAARGGTPPPSSTFVTTRRILPASLTAPVPAPASAPYSDFRAPFEDLWTRDYIDRTLDGYESYHQRVQTGNVAQPYSSFYAGQGEESNFPGHTFLGTGVRYEDYSANYWPNRWGLNPGEGPSTNPDEGNDYDGEDDDGDA